ncbi:hypothetical protein KTO58_12725 [Chitinophaga pendula]|uniref:hypothetical protein n=1 Tax=Chitinophaga TaxID=79328 RepID=UPI0012FE43E9|nr:MULTISPECIES: hypothetical protein [Chitinophaga]UCJ10020.1 hypothetical protein KTO58_12725 [Chitinophaga pendula]
MKKIFLASTLLAASFACKKDSDSTRPDTKATPKDSLVTYTGVALYAKPNDPVNGRLFSTLSGKIYTDNAIPDTIGQHIDIAFNNFGAYSLFFTSPTDEATLGFKIPGARTSFVLNMPDAQVFSSAWFDTLRHASALDTLKITTDQESFEAANTPHVVLFRNAAGKRGAIKVKSFNQQLLIDVKVQY